MSEVGLLAGLDRCVLVFLCGLCRALLAGEVQTLVPCACDCAKIVINTGLLRGTVRVQESASCHIHEFRWLRELVNFMLMLIASSKHSFQVQSSFIRGKLLRLHVLVARSHGRLAGDPTQQRQAGLAGLQQFSALPAALEL